MREGVWMLNGRVVKLKTLSAELNQNHNTFRKHVWHYGLKQAVEIAKMDRHDYQQWRFERWRESYYDDDV